MSSRVDDMVRLLREYKRLFNESLRIRYQITRLKDEMTEDELLEALRIALKEGLI